MSPEGMELLAQVIEANVNQASAYTDDLQARYDKLKEVVNVALDSLTEAGENLDAFEFANARWNLNKTFNLLIGHI